MRYASLCDGIGAAHAAWQPLGWRCAWTSEIEPFPAAVVEQRWQLPNLGDMTKITQEQLDEHGSIDLIVGGTPCQSFSVAGLRKGLDDPRGNLCLRFAQLANATRAKWLVWENVPGVLSSNGGRDFGAFLGALAELRYGFAYRVLDAQHFGVPQRRRRVFVVGCLGDWRRAAAVLFERHSLCGHPAPGKEAGQGVAGTIGAGVGDKTRDEFESIVVHGTQDPIVSDIAMPLGRNAGQENAIAFDTTQITSAANYSNPQPGDACHPLAAGAHAPALACKHSVRRMTPRECERLQGFPDDHTQIKWRNKPADKCPDGPRYKALGNSMAVPVMAWIGKRIEMVNEL